MAKDKGTQYNSLFTLSILCLLDWPGDMKLKMHISKQYDPRSAVLPAQDFRDKWLVVKRQLRAAAACVD